MLKKKAKSKPLVKTASKATARVAVKKVKTVVKRAKKAATEAVKPLKTLLNKSQLIQHYVDELDWERRDVVAFLNAQERLLMRSLAPKSVETFLLPGLLKITLKRTPAKKMPAIKKGQLVKGFGGVEVKAVASKPAWVKPAGVRFRVRAMAKLKGAALG